MRRCKCCGHKADKVGYGFAYCIRCFLQIYGADYDD